MIQTHVETCLLSWFHSVLWKSLIWCFLRKKTDSCLLMSLSIFSSYLDARLVNGSGDFVVMHLDYRWSTVVHSFCTEVRPVCAVVHSLCIEVRCVCAVVHSLCTEVRRVCREQSLSLREDGGRVLNWGWGSRRVMGPCSESSHSWEKSSGLEALTMRFPGPVWW